MNEISSSQNCGEVFKNIMAGSLRGDEVPDLKCNLCRCVIQFISRCSPRSTVERAGFLPGLADHQNAPRFIIFSCCVKVSLSSFSFQVKILIEPGGMSDVSKTWYKDVAIKDVFSDGIIIDCLEENGLGTTCQFARLYFYDAIFCIFSYFTRRMCFYFI